MKRYMRNILSVQKKIDVIVTVFTNLKLKSSEQIEQDSFQIDGKKFYWMSIAEMEQDKRIMEVNSDIVSMVKRVA